MEGGWEGMGKTEVRFNGWHEDGFGQQKNDGGGCAIMKDGKEWRALVHM